MSKKYPLARVARDIPAITAKEGHPVVGQSSSSESSSWFSFSYSYTEVSVVGGSAKVKRSRTRLTDGKLESETFEGTLDRAAFDAMARDVSQQILRQTQRLM